MKKLIMILAAVAVGVAEAAIHRYEAGAGETIGIGNGAANQDPDYPGKGSKFSAFYDLHDGGTLLVTNGTATIWNQIVATNGMAVLDVTYFGECGSVPVFCGGIWTDGGKGWIRVKGCRAITIGSPNKTSFGETGPTDVQRIEFVDKDGNPVTSGTKVLGDTRNLVKDVTSVVPSVSDGMFTRIVGDAPFFEGDTYVVGGKGFYIGSAAALGENQTIQVTNGKFVGFMPGGITWDPDFADSWSRPFVVTNGAGRFACSPRIDLVGSEATLVFSNVSKTVSIDFGGTVTGRGQVVIDKNRTDDVISGSIGVPVVARTGVTLTLADGASLARFDPEDETVRLRLGEGTFALAALSTRIAVTGVGVERSTLNLTGDVTGKSIICDGTFSLAFKGSATPPEGTFVNTLSDGRTLYTFCEAGATIDASCLEPLSTPYDAFAAADGKTYVNLPGGANLRAGEGVSATVQTRVQGGETFTLSLSNGTFTVGKTDVWKEFVDLWFDFSDTTTLGHIGCENPEEEKKHLNESYIERCVDGRHPNAPYSLWNRRAYNSAFEVATTVYPMQAEDARSGLPYLTFATAGSSRRLPLSTGTGYNTNASLPVQLVVMVFGSQNGGGHALVASDGGAFGRSGTTATSGITTNTAHAIWLDGQRVADPTTQALNKGWQIVSIAMDGIVFRGLGMRKNVSADFTDKTYGGQNYGEVLVFTNQVSDLVRCEAEAYLAQKWGITTFDDTALKAARAADPTLVTTVDASGVGTIRTLGTAPVALGGNFAGTVVLDGGKLTVKNAPMPFTAETLPLTDCVGWYDPDDAATRRCIRDFDPIPDGYSNELDGLRLLYNRANPEPENGDAIIVGTGHRMPKAVPMSLGFGAERCWLDFDGTGDDGNALRTAAFDDTINYSTLGTTPTLRKDNIATGFVVVDSRRSCFTPIQSDISGKAGAIYARTASDVAVWSPSTSADVRNGETRLNGRTVNPAHGFSRCPELLTFRPTKSVTAPFYGNYDDTEKKVTQDLALLMGETILYSTKLSDEDTARVEGYLMQKWFGLVPPTCVDATGATVSGTGIVEVAELANRPKVDPAFVGTVSLAATAETGVFEVTIDPETDAVVGGLVAPEASVALPAACTLKVKFASRPKGTVDKEWTVFACKALTSGTTWTLEFEAGVNPNRIQFVQDSNAIKVKSLAHGLLLLVR